MSNKYAKVTLYIMTGLQETFIEGWGGGLIETLAKKKRKKTGLRGEAKRTRREGGIKDRGKNRVDATGKDRARLRRKIRGA